MSKLKTVFTCQSCGVQYPQWQGKCFQCGRWNTLIEEIVKAGSGSQKIQNGLKQPVSLDSLVNQSVNRKPSGLSEFDRVLGGGPPAGGFVPGSVVLLGGEPGIGKSTLVLQIASQVSKTLYVSAEESLQQIKIRADRLGLQTTSSLFLTINDVDVLVEAVQNLNRGGLTKASVKENTIDISLLIIDSIQTFKTDDLSSAPGTISQVQECARRLTSIARELEVPVLLIGQVTKEGNLAGPKTLEHLVDTVLYLEGDRASDFRLLRGVKNRFGSINEVGIFRMTEGGLKEVVNPSQELLKERKIQSPGSVLSVVVEGMRPLILEVQALTSSSPFGLPKRTVNGIDYNRLLMLLAVLQKRAGLSFSNQDVYVTLTGGFKVDDPALDLAVCLSLASALKNIPLDLTLLALGEVDLLGNIKNVLQYERRVTEAKRMGFDKIVSRENCQTLKEALEKSGIF